MSLQRFPSGVASRVLVTHIDSLIQILVTTFLNIIVILSILQTVGCIDRTQKLSNELVDERSFRRKTYMTPWPELMIIANENEITTPPDLYFTPETYEYLSDFDFDRSFAILWSRAQQQDSGTVKEIVRENHKVIIKINPYSIQPGEYLLPDWTPPYQLIRVMKDGEWNQDIQFIVEDASGEIIEEIVHFIP